MLDFLEMLFFAGLYVLSGLTLLVISLYTIWANLTDKDK